MLVYNEIFIPSRAEIMKKKHSPGLARPVVEIKWSFQCFFVTRNEMRDNVVSVFHDISEKSYEKMNFLKHTHLFILRCITLE